LDESILFELNYIGAADPEIVLYIDNQPCWVEDKKVDVVELISENGNHWRKIFTIFAKLCSQSDWREYRDRELLQAKQQINFSDTLCLDANVHIFAGKSCWQRFGITEQAVGDMQASACGKMFYRRSVEHGLMLYTPYFDYRQFPNVLIAEAKLLIDNRTALV